jgi:hypothetical protein
MMYLLEEEFEQRLLEELPSDKSSFSEESDSSETNDLTVGEVISAEFCDNESDVHFSSASESYIYVGGHDKLCRTKGTVC